MIVIAFLVITSILLAIAGLKQYGIDLPDLATRMGLIGMVVVSRIPSRRSSACLLFSRTLLSEPAGKAEGSSCTRRAA